VVVSAMQTFGFTFSQVYCRELGLDPATILSRALKDFPFKSVRLCAYWNQLEPEPHLFDFTELDRFIKKASRAGVDITLAIGRKVPRWPEYHEPEWALKKGEQFLTERALFYIEQTVKHYRSQRAIRSWQIENEPFWSFGHSEYPITEEYVRQATALVRELDPDREIIITDTSEFSDWEKAASYADQIGINIYPASYDEHLYRYQYPGIDVSSLTRKITNIDKPVLVAELQAEPWGPATSTHLPLMERQEREKSMSPQRFKNNLTRIAGLDLNPVWLWGVEWWYWLVEQGDHSMLDAAAELLS